MKVTSETALPKYEEILLRESSPFLSSVLMYVMVFQIRYYPNLGGFTLVFKVC